MNSKTNQVGFFRGAVYATAACLPFWVALGYGVYKLLKLFGY